MDKGLERSCTQMLAYFAVSKLGEEPVDGKTEMNPEGLTSIHGKHADAVAERLHASGMSCKVTIALAQALSKVPDRVVTVATWRSSFEHASQVLGKADFKVQMYEKLIWICAFMIVGATHGGCTGTIAHTHTHTHVLSLPLLPYQATDGFPCSGLHLFLQARMHVE